jgi:hypothetical protein
MTMFRIRLSGDPANIVDRSTSRKVWGALAQVGRFSLRLPSDRLKSRLDFIGALMAARQAMAVAARPASEKDPYHHRALR